MLPLNLIHKTCFKRHTFHAVNIASANSGLADDKKDNEIQLMVVVRTVRVLFRFALIRFLSAGNALIIANEACKPVEVMVPVPQPRKRRALAFPVYVKLFRCSGGCDIEPRLSQCVPTGWSTAFFSDRLEQYISTADKIIYPDWIHSV